MAVDSMRISQILPTVKCSKCSASISLNDMSSHVCSRPGLGMTPIAESPTSEQHESRRPVRERVTGARHDRGLFNSTKNLRHDQAYEDSSSSSWQSGDASRTIQPSGDSQYRASDSNAVLGRIQNLKAGVLGSNGLQRPLPKSRSGPIQTYDPRATMVPIRVDDAHNSRRRPAPPRLQNAALHRHAEDTRSITSSHSNKTIHAKNAVEGSREQHEELFAAALSPTDAGPFHHVSSKLDPTRFVPVDVPTGPNKSYGKKSKSKTGRLRDMEDQDWENEGYDDAGSINSSSYSRHDQRSIRSAGTVMSNRSYDEDYPAGEYRQLPYRQDPVDQARTRTAEKATYLGSSARQARSAQNLYDRSIDAPSRSVNGGSDRPPMARAAASLDSSNALHPQQLPTINVPHSRRDQSKTHARNETSSSLGTVLTNASLFSARSSVSSPPSEIGSNQKSRDIHYRAQAHTPTPQDYENEATPTLKAFGRTKAPSSRAPVLAAALPRSTTTGSFDRLLEDIGSSIDQLKVPKTNFANVEGSPSSNYSPVIAAEPFMSPSRDAIVPKALGSPASLQSKDTTSSKGSRATKPHGTSKTRTKDAKCMACSQLITGKSVSSADGKLTGRYHKSCFRCTNQSCTQDGFPDGQFYVYADRPYCSRHYHAKAGSLCARCGEGIEGECLATIHDERFHVHCHSAQQVDGRGYRHF